MYLGVKAVITKSFARIHRANLINFGIAPLVFSNPSDYDAVSKNDVLYFPSFTEDISKGNPVKGINRKTGKEYLFDHNLSGTAAEVLLAGGMLNYTRQKMA